MTKKSKREKRVVSARRRLEEHSGGFERTTIKVPDGVQMFSSKQPGIRRIEIIPYEAGKGNPFADEGDLHFERTFYTHRNIGPNNESFICLAKTFDKKCPVCEERTRLARDPDSDPDLLKSLRPSERQLFHVLDLADKDKGVQLWDVSYHLFGKVLESAIAMGDDGEYDLFADLEQGLTLKMNIEKGSMGTGNYGEVRAVEFKARKQPLEESLLEQTHCLDDLLKEMPYDKLKAIFLQVDENDEDDEDDEKEESKSKKKTKSTSGKKPAEDDDEDEDDDGDEELDEKDDEDDDDDADDEDEEEEKPAGKGKKIINQAELAGMKVGMMVEHDDFGTCKIVHISGDGTSLKLEDEDGEVHRSCDPDDCEIIEEEEKPKGKSKKSAAKKGATTKKKTDDDEDDDDDDEEGDDDDDDDDEEGDDDDDDDN